MNDDLNDLASAYLDGDVTADERARVLAEPDLLAEVDRMRVVRMLLGDVEAPSISVREVQLAAALDAWDRLPLTERTGARRDITPLGIDAAAVAGAASVTAPTPLSRRRKASSTRWLGAAAASLVLVLAGGVALQLGAENDDDTSSAESAVDGSVEPDTAAAGEPAGEAPQAALDERSSADVLAATGETGEAVTSSSELDTGISDVAPPAESAGLDELTTLTDLADFAAAAVGAPVAPEDVPAATSAPDGELAESALADTQLPVCLGVDLIVGPALYLDVPVVVGIDDGRGVAIAYQPATCAEVARVRLP